MAKTRTGKNIRIPEMAIAKIEVVRAALMDATHIDWLRLTPAIVPSDGMVVALALTMTELLLNPKFSLIDRQKFLNILDREVVRRAPDFSSRTPEDRLAFIDLLMASCCELSAYDPVNRAREAAPEGQNAS